MSRVRLDKVSIRYGSTTAVRDVTIEVEPGEFLALLGASGSGKTSILRALGGYIPIASGSIVVNGQDISNAPPQRRNVGMVFQNYALFPHMTVEKNVAYGLRTRRVPTPELRTRVEESLELVGLAAFGKRYPQQLSGGQQQRVALARAIVVRPSVLLMDEPLGALDAQLRESVQIQIQRVQRALKITTVYVTHDQNEAFGMSDRIVLMRDGEISDNATPAEFAADAGSLYATEFVGRSAVLRGTVQSVEPATAYIEVGGLDKPIPIDPDGCKPGDAVAILIRPQHMSLHDELATVSAGMALARGSVVAQRYAGQHTLLVIEAGNGRFVIDDVSCRKSVGDEVTVAWDQNAARVVSI